MREYLIHESKINMLESRLNSICNKCKKYGCDFSYTQLGEEYRTVKDESGRSHTLRFIRVSCEGTARAESGWYLFAKIDHSIEGHNIVLRAGFENIEIPSKYFTCASLCEHCNTIRPRTYTYILYNPELKEFKQVGSSCVKDFTGGLSAEAAAAVMSGYEFLFREDAYDEDHMLVYVSTSSVYFSIEKFLQYSVAVVDRFGFSGVNSENPTYFKVKDLLERLDAGDDLPTWVPNDFVADSEDIMKETEQIIQWVQEDTSNDSYMRNARSLISSGYFTPKYAPIVCSLVIAYRRYVEQKKREEEREAQRNLEASQSEWVGQPKDKIEIQVKSATLITSWENQYGVAYLYKIVDVNRNVFTWLTSSAAIDPHKQVSKVRATVKQHSLYQDVKQTEVLRCKVEYAS